MVWSRICKGRSILTASDLRGLAVGRSGADMQRLGKKDEGGQGLEDLGINSGCKGRENGGAM
jgi:hypothetical protein